MEKTGCLLCGKKLIYLEKDEKLPCAYCQNQFLSTAKCENNHYVCDTCHSSPAIDLIENYCNNTSEKNPIQMAITLMKHPRIKMHGPEHHFLVPAVLLAAYYNTIDKKKLIPENLEKAKKRAKNILGGFCGFYGNCGAAVGTGIFMSLITHCNPLSSNEWQQTNLITAESLKKIAIAGGPRCCKRNTFLAILNSIQFLKQELNVSLEISSKVLCSFMHLNKECIKEKCAFFPKEKKLKLNNN